MAERRNIIHRMVSGAARSFSGFAATAAEASKKEATDPVTGRAKTYVARNGQSGHHLVAADRRAAKKRHNVRARSPKGGNPGLMQRRAEARA